MLASAAALFALCGCETQSPPPADSGLAVWFAGLSSPSGCSPTGNGKGVVPADVSSLSLRYSAETAAGPVTRIVRIAPGAVGNKGTWLIKDVPAGSDVQLELYGCSAGGDITYVGSKANVRVDAGKETPVRLFLAPTERLACAGAPLAGSLQAGRALMGSDTMADGTVAVVGGIAEWDGATGSGKASALTDLYDPTSGQWRPGPNLLVPRVAPHVVAVSPTQMLVVGGTTGVQLLGDIAALPNAYVMAPAKIASASPQVAAELVDWTKPTTSGVAVPSAVGEGALPLSSAVAVPGGVVFVGGYDATGGAPVAAASRLTGLAALAQGQPGNRLAQSLTHPRLRPGLVATDSGEVVVWGGAISAAPPAASMGELLGATGSAVALTVTGPPALLTDPAWMTWGAAVIRVPATGPLVRFLVAGGAPLLQPDNAAAAPAYLVTVDPQAKTAQVTPVTTDAGPLRAGLLAGALALPGGRILLAGGLLGLTDAGNSCTTANECLVHEARLLQLPTPIDTAGATLVQQQQWSLGGPRLGIAMAATKHGAVLVGGLESVRQGVGSSSLEAAGAVVTLVPATADRAVLCGP
jgi:hypothetical protein